LFNRAVRADQPGFTVIWRWDEGEDDIAVPVAIIASTGAMFSERGEGQIFDRADFKAPAMAGSGLINSAQVLTLMIILR